MVGCHGCAEDKVLPIGLCRSCKLGDAVTCFGAFRECLAIEVHEFGCRHYRNFLCDLLHADRAGVCHLRPATQGTFLCRDEDYSVGGAGTVDGCR